MGILIHNSNPRFLDAFALCCFFSWKFSVSRDLVIESMHSSSFHFFFVCWFFFHWSLFYLYSLLTCFIIKTVLLNHFYTLNSFIHSLSPLFQISCFIESRC